MTNSVWLKQASELSGFETAGAEARSPLLDATVMMVDDEPLMTELVQMYLEDAGYAHFVACNDPLEVLGLLRRHEPSVLLLDLMMPGLSGLELLQRIRGDRELRTLPVIVLTAAAGADTKVHALQLGATDFLGKPVDASELVLRVRNTLAFKHFHDCRANLDAVTKLPNAQYFEHQLGRLLARALERNEQVALLNIMVPECASLRETLGLPAAGQLAQTVGERLGQLAAARGTFGHSVAGATAAPTVARLGVDSFALLLPRLSDGDAAAAMGSRVTRELARMVEIDGLECQPSPSVGIAIAPHDGGSAAELLKASELARSEARLRGGLRHEFYSHALNARLQERLQLVEALRRAVHRGEMRLHYQPKVDIASGRIVGVEALVRWQHAERGLLAPGLFIPLAEEQGLMGDIGDWVVAQACSDAARWANLGVPALKVAVNVTKQQFASGCLPDTLKRALQGSGLPAQRLVVELTESMLMSDADGALEQMQAVKAVGVSLSIDDFGTGYSSFSYLKRFPLDELKIDRSFVVDLPGGKRDLAIVRSIAAVGHDLGLNVIAEGVETSSQLEALRSVGCDEYQGFLFSRPVPEAQLLTLLRAAHGERGAEATLGNACCG